MSNKANYSWIFTLSTKTNANAQHLSPSIFTVENWHFYFNWPTE